MWICETFLLFLSLVRVEGLMWFAWCFSVCSSVALMWICVINVGVWLFSEDVPLGVWWCTVGNLWYLLSEILYGLYM